MMIALLKRIFGKPQEVETIHGKGKIITRVSPELRTNKHSKINSYKDMLLELDSGQRIFINEGEILKKPKTNG